MPFPGVQNIFVQFQKCTVVAQSAACSPVPSGFHHSLAIKQRAKVTSILDHLAVDEKCLCISLPSLFLVLSEEGECQVRLEPWCVLLWRVRWIESDAFWHVSSRNVSSDCSASSPACTRASSASVLMLTGAFERLWTGGSRRQNGTMLVFLKSAWKSRKKNLKQTQTNQTGYPFRC